MKDVNALQSQFETDGLALVDSLDAQGVTDAERLDEAYRQHAEKVLPAVWGLADTIIERYADGYVDDKVQAGYPDWWLRDVGYQNGPPPAPAPLAIKEEHMQHATRACIAGPTQRVHVLQGPIGLL